MTEQKVSDNIINEKIVNERIDKAKEINEITLNIIWKKMLSQGCINVNIKIKLNCLYLYKMCALNIYKMNKEFLKENITKFKDLLLKKEIDQDNYNLIIHNIMFLLC